MLFPSQTSNTNYKLSKTHRPGKPGGSWWGPLINLIVKRFKLWTLEMRKKRTNWNCRSALRSGARRTLWHNPLRIDWVGRWSWMGAVKGNDLMFSENDDLQCSEWDQKISFNLIWEIRLIKAHRITGLINNQYPSHDRQTHQYCKSEKLSNNECHD